MEKSTHEVEVKLPFDSPSAARERLERLGATRTGPRQFEDNLVFDLASGALAAADKLLRLRRSGSRALLTFKAPVRGEHRHKVREEHEIRVEDPEALLRILDGLGFATAYRYQKYRTVYGLGELCLCLDETPIGCFVELEGRPEEIDRTAERMGFGPRDYETATYRELHLRDARERGVEAGDLMVERPEADGRA